MPRAFTETERQVLKQKVHEAGRRAIGRTGLRRLNVEAVARAAGISKGAFYLFYGSKEELLVDVLTGIETELRADLERRLAGCNNDPRALIATFLRFQFEVFDREPVLAVLADPEEASVLFRAIPTEELERRKAEDDVYFAALFDRWRREGVLGPEDPTVLAGLPRVALALVQQRDMIGRDRFQALVDLLVEGLVCRLTPTSPPQQSSGGAGTRRAGRKNP